MQFSRDFTSSLLFCAIPIVKFKETRCWLGHIKLHHRSFAGNLLGLLYLKSLMINRWGLSCNCSNQAFCFGDENHSKKWKVASQLSFLRSLHWTFRITCPTATSKYLRPINASHKLTRKCFSLTIYLNWSAVMPKKTCISCVFTPSNVIKQDIVCWLELLGIFF